MASKKDLSERDICTQFILPALIKAGWNVENQIREEAFGMVHKNKSLGTEKHSCGLR